MSKTYTVEDAVVVMEEHITVHLLDSSCPYDDSSWWCGVEFPDKYSANVDEVTCMECLDAVSEFAKAALARREKVRQ